MENKKIFFWDWKKNLGIFLIISSLLAIIISLILLGTANFIDDNNNFLGNGFWSLNHYGLMNIFYHWNQLDDYQAVNIYLSHPFLQVYVSIILMIITFPLCFGLGLFLFIRGWLKSTI